MVGSLGLTHGAPVFRNLSRHHWEDWRFFRHNRTFIHDPLDCFTRPSIWPGLYRPLSTNCYYLAGRTLAGNRVEIYHLVNLAVFVANALLLFSLSRRLLPGPWAFLPPVLMASRLAHIQVLLYTSEFQGLSAALFSLAALLALAGARVRGSWRGEVVSLLLFVLALLCKESAVALPALVTAWSWLFEERPRWPRNLLWWLLGGLWAVLFATVFRGVSGHEPTGFGYDFSPGIVARFAAHFLAFFNVLVYPPDNRDMVARVPALAGTGIVLAGFGLLAILQVVVASCARKLVADARTAPLRVTAFGFAWFAAGTAPFAVFADRLFMRYGYFGHAGVALMVTGAAALLVQELRARRTGRGVASAATDSG